MLPFICFCNLWNEVLLLPRAHPLSHVQQPVREPVANANKELPVTRVPSIFSCENLHWFLESSSYLFSAAKFHIIFRKEERGHDVKWAILNALNKFKPKNSCDFKKNPSINMCCVLYSSDHQMIYIYSIYLERVLTCLSQTLDLFSFIILTICLLSYNNYRHNS